MVEEPETLIQEDSSKQTVEQPEILVQDAGSKETAVAQAAEDRDDRSVSVQKTEDSEAFEKGKIAGLQEAILAIMEKIGPVTDRMRQDVLDNVYHDSLIKWIKSFR